MLLTAHPEAARGVDLGGFTPLHVACAAGSSTGIIMALLQVNPEAVVMRTEKGSTPIKCLAKNAENRQEVKEILKQAKTCFDANFNNPLLAKPILLMKENSVVLV
jgi:hypothetical protein